MFWVFIKLLNFMNKKSLVFIFYEKSKKIVVGSWAILKLRLDLLKNPLGITSEPIFIVIIVGCLECMKLKKSF